jgi:hypothetical protein
VDTPHLAALVRSLREASSRRGLLGGLAATALAPAALCLPGEAEAKKKRKNRKKKRKKQNVAVPAPVATAPPPTVPPAPPPPDPVETADAACPAAARTATHSGSRRFAQTFRALRSGQLIRASFVLTFNGEDAAFDLEIREVDAAGAPSSGVLASIHISGVPRTGLDDPPLTVGGVFGSSAATVVAGQRYALVVTEASGQKFSVQTNSSTNECAEGNLFFDLFATGNFTSIADADLVFATFVKG